MEEARALESKRAALSIESAENCNAATILFKSCLARESPGVNLSCSWRNHKRVVRLKKDAVVADLIAQPELR